MGKNRRKKREGRGNTANAPVEMGEIIAPAAEVPNIPTDTREAVTAADFVIVGKGKQKNRHFVEKCKLIGSVTNGVLTVSVRDQGIIVSLRLEDVMAFMAAVTQAAHEEEATAQRLVDMYAGASEKSDESV